MKQCARWSMAMILVFIATSALADPAYINSRKERVELTPSQDFIAVVPASRAGAADAVAQFPGLDLGAGAVLHSSGLWEIPLQSAFWGKGDSLVAELKQAGLIERVGAVFFVPGSPRRLLLDRTVIVKLNQSISTLPQALLADTGLRPILELGHQGNTFLCQARDAEQALIGSRIAAGLTEVAWALPDFIVPMNLYLQPNDTYYGEQWYHAQASDKHIHSEEAWDVTTGDIQVIVSVIDTGLDEDHPDFDPARIVTGYNVVNGTNDPTPPGDSMNAHGTCCSGTIAATINNNQGLSGVCPGCSLMGIRMMDAMADASQISQGYLAFDYAVDNGAWVISNSWGISEDQTGQVDMQPYYDAVANAVQNGRNGLGCVVLFASGNGDPWTGQAVPIGAHELANLPEIMAVGGTGYNDQHVSYSNYGPNLSVVAPTGYSSSSSPPDYQIITTDTVGTAGFSRNGTFWAPSWWGSDEDTGYPEPDSTGNYTRYFNGTSAATPIAAGVVAMVFSANPALTGTQARFVVERTADKVGGVTYDQNGHNTYYGFGRVNAGRAVRAAQLGFDVADGQTCAESFNCTSGDCRKNSVQDFYGVCSGADCSGQSNGAPCVDGDACTENDACQDGVCVGTAKDCSDGNACTDDSCEAVTGLCKHVNNSLACDDNNLCTSGDACVNGTCRGTAMDCNDDNPCTTDSCNTSTGECQYTNNTSSCNDSNPCTQNDRCSAGVCQGTAKNCNDNDPCTDDSCDTSNGVCQHTNNSAPCDDQDPCTANDQCVDGVCHGTASSCDDNNPCTDDLCESSTGVCQHVNNIQACDDGNGCTLGDQCAEGVCSGVAKNCDDHNPCTDDSCNAGTGACVHANNSVSCDDSDPCTQNDRCSAGVCAGTAKDCSSLGGPCSTGACNLSTGQCESNLTADGTACNTGDSCILGATCKAGQCQGGENTCDSGGGCGCSAASNGPSLLSLLLMIGLISIQRRRSRQGAM